ncbi:MAG: hypothetical protein WBW33_37080 [Bryobacteraceae bacterium]
MDPPPGYIGDAGDLMFVRKAAMTFLDTLKPGDRVAVFTTSGLVALDFTLDRVKLREALLRLQYREHQHFQPFRAQTWLGGRSRMNPKL